ncbi:MAG: cyclic nucleotide-binding domain-containing protein [Bacteroidia bacterium]
MSHIDFIKKLDQLKDVPEPQIEWFLSHAEIRDFKIGDAVFAKGQPADELYIIVEGAFRIYLERNGEKREMGKMSVGDITGLLPYSRMTHAGGNAIANEPAKVICFHRKHFSEMIKTQFELTQAFVHVMTNRIRTFTTLQIQNEKLMSLGKLSAGLAHELNNPASAIVRSANALRDHLKGQPDKFKKVINIKMDSEQVDTINDLLFSKIDNHKSNQLSLMDRNDLEDDLTDWLEDNEIESPFDLVENLVEFDFSIDDLELVKDNVNAENFRPIIGWIENNLSTEKMVEEIQEASTRIADLIGSIKGYTHMDRSRDFQKVNIHDGLRSTVTMLKHKIKKNQIIFIEDFAASLPPINGFPGELNQVFTNILDNAIDALAEYNEEPNPTITLRTVVDGSFVKTYIKDNGPGIPEDMVNQIFDPFFTTKEMGKGTGLGLDVVMKIIRQHRGDVRVNSEKGSTEFEVCLPTS